MYSKIILLIIEFHSKSIQIIPAPVKYIKKAFVEGLCTIKSLKTPPNWERNKIFEKEVKMLLESIKETHFEEFLRLKSLAQIEWKFIPPYSPWVGGIWESAVKSVKRYLLPMLAVEYKTALEIQSAMIQCTAILNSRPLCTYHTAEGEQILTPAHLVKVKENETLYMSNQSRGPLAKFHMHQSMMRLLKQHFYEDYLEALRKRTSKTKSRPDFPIGRLVVLPANPSDPSEWPIGLIVKGSKGTDGVTRFVDARTRNGKIRTVCTSKIALIPRNDDLATYIPEKEPPLPTAQKAHSYTESELDPLPKISKCRDTYKRLRIKGIPESKKKPKKDGKTTKGAKEPAPLNGKLFDVSLPTIDLKT